MDGWYHRSNHGNGTTYIIQSAYKKHVALPPHNFVDTLRNFSYIAHWITVYQNYFLRYPLDKAN